MSADPKNLIEIPPVPELVMRRTFDAPRALVFKAWLEPRHLAAWWGPTVFTNPVCEADGRPGGVLNIIMQGPDGKRYPCGGQFYEIEEPRRLTLGTWAEDAEGRVLENHIEVLLEERDGKTEQTVKVNLVMATPRSKPFVAGMRQGWNQSLDKLGAYVRNGIPLFSVARVFKAPRELVFKVHTDPFHLAKWFGPAGTTVIKADMDLRPGGTYHYGLRMPDGAEMWGRQVFREVTAPEKLVLVQSFSDSKGGITRHPMAATWPLEMLATTTFDDLGGGDTALTISWEPLNATPEEIATFDHARAGMDGGFKGTLDALEAYLATL